jgi:hypothetical protein
VEKRKPICQQQLQASWDLGLIQSLVFIFKISHQLKF